MNSAEIAAARGLITAGIPQHTIAALFQVNSARIAEAKNAKSEKMIDVKAADGYPVLTVELIDVLCTSAVEKKTLLHGVFVLDPAVCTKLTDKRGGRNDGNRKLKWNKIKDEFAPAMASDGWFLNGETVKFSDEATMVDGQNRCTAATVAGASFKSLAVFGVPRSYFHTVDVGKPRSSADLFVFQGVKNANVVSGAVRWVMILNSATPHQNLTYPAQNVLAVYIDAINWDVMDDSVAISRNVHTKAHKDIAHSILCALHYVLAEDDRTRANRFFISWASGDPWFQPLNLRLSHLASQYGGKSRPSHVTIGTILQAWTVWRKDQKVRMTGKNSLTYERGPFEQWR